MPAKPTNGFDKNPQNRYKGGAKKKIFTILKDKGFSKDDISEAFRNLAFYNEKEMIRIRDGVRQPMVTRIIAGQFLQALDKKDYTKIKDLVEQVIGRPSQSVQSTVTTIEQPLLPDKYNKKAKK